MRYPITALPPTAALRGGPSGGLSWRHLLTFLLVCFALPVFALSAAVVLPVLIVVGGTEMLRRHWWLRTARTRRD
jgi:hypothetical protein